MKLRQAIESLVDTWKSVVSELPSLFNTLSDAITYVEKEVTKRADIEIVIECPECKTKKTVKLLHIYHCQNCESTLTIGPTIGSIAYKKRKE